MGLITKLVGDALTSVSSVMQKEIGRLRKEAAKLNLVIQDIGMMELGEKITTGENVKEVFKTFFYKGDAKADNAVIANVTTDIGNVFILIPFGHKDVLAPEFLIELDVTARGAAVLERSLMGSFGTGSWREAPETNKGLSKKLDEASIGFCINWNHELRGDFVLKLDWGLQILPQAPGKTLLLIKSGYGGFIGKKIGLKPIIKEAKKIKEVLSQFSETNFKEKSDEIYGSYAKLCYDNQALVFDQ